jgi:hypothetical protein
VDPRVLLLTEGKPYIEAAGLVIAEDVQWPFVTATGNLAGNLFQNTPAFFSGVLTYNQTLTGTTFVLAPTFSVGAVTGGNVLTGTTFVLAPTFSVGAVTGGSALLAGVTFTKAPTFSVGVISGGSQTLAGTPFQPPILFSAGTISTSGGAGTAPSTTDEGLRFEVWTQPQLGTFTRKYDLSRWVNAFTIADKFGEISDGTLTIAESLPKEKIDQLILVDRANHANDEGSVIRVLRGTTPILHYVTKQFDDTWSSDDPTATLSLEGMDLLLDRAIVPRHDYPANPSVEPDWVYGATSILTNTGFEVSETSSEVVTLEINATAGTYKIGTSYPNGAGFVYTANIPYNALAADIAIAIENSRPGWDVLISGAGTSTNPFVIEVLVPAEEDIGWATDSGLLTGLASVFTETPGGNLITDTWTRSMQVLTGVFHGSYTTFEITTEQAHTGTYSLKIDGDPPAYPTAFPGAQQVLAVTPGRTYRASVWVYPTQTAAFRFVIRTRDETYIASDSTVLTAGSWQQISSPTVTIPNHVSQIVFRIANLSALDEPPWYVDDALFAPGAEAATYGAIMSDILAPIQANGVLTWLTPTWSDTLDSSGQVWDRNLQWSVKRGQTMLQLVEYAKRWNYESKIRWDDAQSRFEWDLFNPTSGGIDYQGTGLAITGRSISSSGVIARRFPEASYFLAEGEGGYWGEHVDTTMSGAWGRLEQYFGNVQGLDAAGLDELADRLVEDSVNRTDGLSVRIQQPSALPWSKFVPGDKLKVNLEPQRDAEVMRCMAVVASKGPDDASPAYDVHFGSVVYQGQAAVLQTLRILWREFKALRSEGNRDTIVNPVPIPPLVGSGSTPTVVIAAADSTDGSKAGAQYKCLGTDDQVTWQAAVSFLDQVGGGRLVVCEGTYSINGPITIGGHIRIEGMGRGETVVQHAGGSPHQLFVLTGAVDAQQVAMSNFTVTGHPISSIGSHGIVAANFGLFVSLTLTDMEIAKCQGAGVYWDRQGGNFIATNCYVHNNVGNGLTVIGEGRNLIVNSVIVANDGHGIDCTGAVAIVVGNRVALNDGIGLTVGGFLSGPYNLVVGNEFISNGGGGIDFYNVTFAGKNVIVGNLCDSNAGHGISCGGDQGHHQITGNLCDSNALSGIRVAGIGGTVSANSVMESGQHGIHLTNADQMVVSANLVASNSKLTNATYDGIFVENDSDKNLITANRVFDLAGGNGQRYGINISAANCDGNVYVGNFASDGGRTAGYNNAGTATVIAYPGAAAPVGDNF